MRVTTAFNKMLGLVGASVASVDLHTRGSRGRAASAAGQAPLPVRVEDLGRSTTARCAAGGTWTWARRRCVLEAEIVRIDCRRCGRVRTEEVPWARPRARHSRDFQDVVCWLAQRTDKTTISRLMRIDWEAVAKIVVDVVAEAIDDTRLDDLYRIGVDEVCYRKGHRYLTVVADHDREGAVVWVGEGKDHGVLEAFYDELGDERMRRSRPSASTWAGPTRWPPTTRPPRSPSAWTRSTSSSCPTRRSIETRREAWNQCTATPDSPRPHG